MSLRAEYNSSKVWVSPLRGGGQAAYQNPVPRLIQHAVVAGTVSQVQTDGQLGLLENLLPSYSDGAILFHKPVSFALRLERVNPWERIASRRRPAFSSHLRSSIKVEVKKKHPSCGWNFSCF